LRKGRKGEDADFRRLVGPQNSPAPRCDPNDDAFWVGWGADREETCRALEDDGTSKTTRVARGVAKQADVTTAACTFPPGLLRFSPI
jgi:hypothetical protein